MNKKVIGYITSAIGLVLALLSFKTPGVSFFSGIKPAYIMIAGVVIIIIGVSFTFTKSSNKIKHAQEEVPIYEGVGKNRRIIGYRREKD